MVEVTIIENDWLHLAEGTYILYGKGESAERNGLSEMPLDEINAEIEASRNERKATAV